MEEQKCLNCRKKFEELENGFFCSKKCEKEYYKLDIKTTKK